MNAKDREIIKIIQGDKRVMKGVLRFISEANTRIDACVDKTRPALSKDIEQIRKLILYVRTKGVRLRYITEITKDNVYYCKQLLEIVGELRHLDGIKGAFYVNDKECLVPAIIHEKGKLYSSVNSFMRNVRNGPLAVEAANRRNVTVTVLTPMDETVI